MSFGEHLEELRFRLIKALAGFVIAFVVCLAFVRDWVFPILCKPILDALAAADLPAQLYDPGAGSSFSVYLKISAIGAIVVASPWMLWQGWQFVAAGLYANERKIVTRHIPLSMALLVAGVAFAYWVVLPMTLQFFISFTTNIPLPSSFEPVASTQPTTLPIVLPIIEGDPVNPPNGSMWINQKQHVPKMFLYGRERNMQYASEKLVMPMMTLDSYTDMLLMLLLVFGVSFQTPLLVMLLVRVGIFNVSELKAMRRIVYFVLVIVAALITPGDVITATIALVIPLCGLYELGLLLARDPAEPAPAAAERHAR